MSTFGFNGLDLRVVLIDDQPWFVAADVVQVLGISRADNLLRHLHEGEKQVTPRSVRAYTNLHHRSVLLSESGLYKLIMRSDKPEAARFQDWVTQDVLPTIRKTGAYVMGEEKVAQGLVTEDQMAS